MITVLVYGMNGQIEKGEVGPIYGKQWIHWKMVITPQDTGKEYYSLIRVWVPNIVLITQTKYKNAIDLLTPYRLILIVEANGMVSAWNARRTYLK